MTKDDWVYIDHIQASLSKIDNYIDGMTEQEFLADEKTSDAVIRQFEIIGEATKNISSTFRNNHNTIPWKDMAGMRDVLIHDYMGVDIWMVWKTAIEDAPILLEELLKLK
ncbi:MAG: DUF86 domain-containing protein [Cyclobacteriaceae bacterium]|nr:DUF86 domain-containing protein [Cyclobacteriaceae bacterium]